MPTIKTKRTMKAREFIVFGIKNNIKNLIVNAINEECREKTIIHFDSNAMPIVSDNVCPYHIYEVEVEEEITEDTVIRRVLIRNVLGDCRILNDVTINKLNNLIIQVYLMNDDDTIGQLIWTKEKGLIE